MGAAPRLRPPVEGRNCAHQLMSLLFDYDYAPAFTQTLHLYMLSADEQIELEELKLFIEKNPHLAIEYVIKHRKDYLILRKELEIVLSLSQFLEARVNLLLKQTRAKG